MKIVRITCLSPVMRKTKKHKHWILEDAWVCEIILKDEGVIRIEIEKDFEFDLASVPVFLQSCCDPGHRDYKTLIAALIHDGLYTYMETSRDFADKLFYEVMRYYKLKKARIYYTAVKLFGLRAWKSHHNDPQKALIKFFWEDR